MHPTTSTGKYDALEQETEDQIRVTVYRSAHAGASTGHGSRWQLLH